MRSPQSTAVLSARPAARLSSRKYLERERSGGTSNLQSSFLVKPEPPSTRFVSRRGPFWALLLVHYLCISVLSSRRDQYRPTGRSNATYTYSSPVSLGILYESLRYYVTCRPVGMSPRCRP